jgi:ankyrin repeat protein
VRGPAFRAATNQELTPLHLVSRRGRVEFAPVLSAQRSLIIERGAVNAEDDDQLAPLHLAAQDGHVEFTLVLIAHGAWC